MYKAHEKTPSKLTTKVTNNSKLEATSNSWQFPSKLIEKKFLQTQILWLKIWFFSGPNFAPPEFQTKSSIFGCNLKLEHTHINDKSSWPEHTRLCRYWCPLWNTQRLNLPWRSHNIKIQIQKDQLNSNQIKTWNLWCLNKVDTKTPFLSRLKLTHQPKFFPH
jgi:hypothetical protein